MSANTAPVDITGKDLGALLDSYLLAKAEHEHASAELSRVIERATEASERYHAAKEAYHVGCVRYAETKERLSAKKQPGTTPATKEQNDGKGKEQSHPRG